VHERLVARGELAVRLVQRVLESDPRVEPSVDRVGEEHPRGLSVTVLEPGGGEAEPADLLDTTTASAAPTSTGSTMIRVS
jgi:hypothetical protein